MGTFHVVGIDLELRLGVDLGVLAYEYIVVRLVCLGLLGIGCYSYPAMEGSMGTAPGNTVEQLPRDTPADSMAHLRAEGNLFLASAEVYTVQADLGSFPSEV